MIFFKKKATVCSPVYGVRKAGRAWLGWTRKAKDSWYTSSDVLGEPYVRKLVTLRDRQAGSSFRKAK